MTRPDHCQAARLDPDSCHVLYQAPTVPALHTRSGPRCPFPMSHIEPTSLAPPVQAIRQKGWNHCCRMQFKQSSEGSQLGNEPCFKSSVSSMHCSLLPLLPQALSSIATHSLPASSCFFFYFKDVCNFKRRKQSISKHAIEKRQKNRFPFFLFLLQHKQAKLSRFFPFSLQFQQRRVMPSIRNHVKSFLAKRKRIYSQNLHYTKKGTISLTP